MKKCVKKLKKRKTASIKKLAMEGILFISLTEISDKKVPVLEYRKSKTIKPNVMIFDLTKFRLSYPLRITT